jgi:hypothetical protein
MGEYVCCVMWIVSLVVGITWLGDLLALAEGHAGRYVVVVVTDEGILCCR